MTTFGRRPVEHPGESPSVPALALPTPVAITAALMTPMQRTDSGVRGLIDDSFGHRRNVRCLQSAVHLAGVTRGRYDTGARTRTEAVGIVID
jgi:hypothetical protein